MQGGLGGKANSALRHSHVGFFFFFFVLSEVATRMENAGTQRRGLRSRTLAVTVRVANAVPGTETSSSRPRSTAAEAKPETAIAASMAASTMNSRLLVVLSAATPMTSATPR